MRRLVKPLLPLLFVTSACIPEPESGAPGYYHSIAERKGMTRSVHSYDHDGDGMLDEVVLTDSPSVVIIRKEDIIRHWIWEGYEPKILNYDPAKVEAMSPMLRNNMSADYRMIFED